MFQRFVIWNLNFAMEGVALTASTVANSWSTATPLIGVWALSATAMLVVSFLMRLATYKSLFDGSKLRPDWACNKMADTPL